MKNIGDIISEELFMNAFEICQKYIVEENFILDVNLRILRKSLLKLKKSKIKSFYETYIKNDLVFSLPEFFSTDVVFVPKNITSVREYRFFSTFSLILYNAIGLLFVDCCSQMIDDLDFKRKNVFAYYPTKFSRKEEEDKLWNVKSTYKSEYNNYSK